MLLFFKQKTAYEMRISDWSSDVCSSDLYPGQIFVHGEMGRVGNDDRGQHLRMEDDLLGMGRLVEIGRATCRERVCQYVSISVVAVSLKKTTRCYSNVIYVVDYIT